MVFRKITMSNQETTKLSDCCVNGYLTSSTPTGTTTTLGSTTCYISTPSTTPTTLIILCTDVFGIYPNLQCISDALALQGYLCIIPDLFNGRPISTSFLEKAMKEEPWEPNGLWERFVVNNLRMIKRMVGGGFVGFIARNGFPGSKVCEYVKR